MAPKVFISHATEDKERFVLDFAKKLRANGIDAWLDIWEMMPGDSLIDKIFNEGIKEAQGFIIVLSINSISKKWVKEELNAALVRRIDKKVKVIPVIIDDCEIPVALRNLIWVKIDPLRSYNDEVIQIVNSIFNFAEKPPLGKPASYLQYNSTMYPNLEKIDTYILDEACKYAIDNDSYTVSSSDFLESLANDKISMNILQETISILDKYSYINIKQKAINGFVHTFNLTSSGLKKYIINNYYDYDNYKKAIAKKIAIEKESISSVIADKLGLPHMMVVNIMEEFISQGYIKANRAVPNIILIYQTDLSMNRLVRNFK